MIEFDYFTKGNRKKHNPNWRHIPDHPFRLLIIGGLESRKTNTFLNLISHQSDIDKIYLSTKDPFEAKYQLSTNKCEGAGLKHCSDFIVFIEYSNYIYDIYENIEKYKPDQEGKVLMVFDDMIAMI